MAEYLKPREYYVDLYDKHTVAQCRSWLQTAEDVVENDKGEKFSAEESKRVKGVVNEFFIYFHTGDRYIKKEETIQGWMRRDEARDRFFEMAQAPDNITCPTCGRLMFVSSKHLNTGFDDEKDRVLFFYDCPLNHLPRRALYDNGEEFKREKPLCPNCKTPVIEEDKDTEEKFLTLITCPACGYTDTREIERTANKEEIEDPDFEKDRARFCLSEEKGREFMEAKENMEQLKKFLDEQKEREREKDVYNSVAKLRKLKIVELEELLAPILEKAGYIKLQFKTPEITKDVIVPFVVYEQRPDREGRASTSDLESLLRKTLKDTNWRLMSDGTSYRLGMLEGRLHGYEREEDLVGLVRQNLKKELKQDENK